MLWNKARRSDNVDDTRQGKDARRPTGKIIGTGLAASVLAGAALYSTFSSGPEIPAAPPQHTQSQTVSPEDTQLHFIESILGDTEDTWKQLFAQTGRHYPAPALMVFSDDVVSGCGYAAGASGPFFCPQNTRIYLDPQFFARMAGQFAVVGEFAQAFIIAHEVGHHVQLELGLSGPFEEALAARRPVAGDAGLEVRAELQADCLAGVWAHHAQQRLAWLEPGDIEAALNAATTDHLRRRRSATRT